MKHLHVFVWTLALTCLAMFPATVRADDDDLANELDDDGDGDDGFDGESEFEEEDDLEEDGDFEDDEHVEDDVVEDGMSGEESGDESGDGID